MDTYELIGKYRNPEEQAKLKEKMVEYAATIKTVILMEMGDDLTPEKRKTLEEKMPEDMVKFTNDNSPAHAMPLSMEIHYNLNGLIDMMDKAFKDFENNRPFLGDTNKPIARSEIITTEKDYLDTFDDFFSSGKTFEEYVLSTMIHECCHNLLVMGGGIINEGFTELMARELASKYPDKLKYWEPAHSKESKFARQMKERLGRDWRKIVLKSDKRSLISALGKNFEKVIEINERSNDLLWNKQRIAYSEGRIVDAFKAYRDMEFSYMPNMNKQYKIKNINNEVNRQQPKAQDSLMQMHRLSERIGTRKPKRDFDR